MQYYLDMAGPSRVGKYSGFLGSQESAVFHFGTNANDDVGSVWYAPDQVIISYLREVLFKCLLTGPQIGWLYFYAEDQCQRSGSACCCGQVWPLLIQDSWTLKDTMYIYNYRHWTQVLVHIVLTPTHITKADCKLTQNGNIIQMRLCAPLGVFDQDTTLAGFPTYCVVRNFELKLHTTARKRVIKHKE